MGNLVVKRTSSAMGALIGWDVLVDGVNVGKLKNGKSIECDVAPGTHVAYVSTSQWFSNEVPFVIDGARPNAVIECALGKPGKQFATAMAFGAIGAAVANASAKRKGENQITATLVE